MLTASNRRTVGLNGIVWGHGAQNASQVHGPLLMGRGIEKRKKLAGKSHNQDRTHFDKKCYNTDL